MTRSDVPPAEEKRAEPENWRCENGHEYFCPTEAAGKVCQLCGADAHPLPDCEGLKDREGEDEDWEPTSEPITNEQVQALNKLTSIMAGTLSIGDFDEPPTPVSREAEGWKRNALALWTGEHKQRNRAIAAEAREAELVEALEFYANPASYKQAIPTRGLGSIGSALPIHEDLGAIARSALERKP